MNSGATWTIADGGVSGKLWAGLHYDRKNARPHHSIGRARYCRRGGRVTACQMSHMGHKRTNRRRPKFKFVRCCPKADKISALRRPRQAGPPLQPRSATMQDNANSELPAPKHMGII